MQNEHDNQPEKLGNTDKIEIEVLDKGTLDSGSSARIAVAAEVGNVGQCGCVADCSCDINCSGCVGNC